MNPDSISKAFQSRVCEQIELLPEGVDRFRVQTPFRFEDGDHFGIVLKREHGAWILTDEASTLMHLSYWLDETELEGNRSEIIHSSLEGFSVEDRDGEFVIAVEEERFGDALYNFVQALSKVTDVSFLSRERVRSTFMDDLRVFIEQQVPAERLTLNWHDPLHDKHKQYPVDFRVNSLERPLFIYALPSDGKVKDATINLLNFERWNLRFQSLAVFEDQQRIGRTTLAKFTDVCDKAYSNLDENKDRIGQFLQRILHGETAR
jgi:hypothetical protein